MAILLKISVFGGLIPKLANHLLPDVNAQIANNVKLQSGELRELREPKHLYTPSRTLPSETLYNARWGESEEWLTWSFDVDVVRAPLPVEVESRFIWTGDGIPRIGTFSDVTNGGGDDYPKVSYALGIPAPVTKPTVTPSGGSGATTTRIYSYTFYSILGEESAPSPASDLTTGKDDDTWAISGMDAIPLNTGDINALTHTGAGKSVTITTTGVHMNRVGEQITVAGVTTVTNVNGTWTLTAVSLTAKTMTFSVTSTPSGTYNNGTDTTDTWTRTVSFNTSGMLRRLYRSTGLYGTIQLVDDDVSTTHNDTLTDAQILGDELISTGWLQPPVGLTGIAVHPSGALVGFSDNSLWFSVPFQAHAFPAEYQLSTDREIVGIGTVGSEVGVATRGNPWMASGVEPQVMTFDKVEGMFPCLSKRSLTGYAEGLIYASAHGLVWATRDGVTILTAGLYTKDEWKQLAPETMVCAAAYGRIYISYQKVGTSVRSMLILDAETLTTADVIAYDLYTDDSTGELYIAEADGISEWDHAASYPLQSSWRSKEYILPLPVNFGAAKVEFDPAIDPATQAAILAAIAAATAANVTKIAASTGINGSYNSHTYNEQTYHGTDLDIVPDNPPENLITFILWKNRDELVISRVVDSNRVFRLPDGYKAQEFSVEILSQCVVREVRVAETPYGLRDA